VKGIGPVTAKKLLRAFGSLEAVLEADPEDLKRVAGGKAAGAIKRHFA
jgi:excinuclease UvrABC nuclease subunit